MKQKNKKVGIIGHFGFGKEFFDGQTVKTKILYEELKKSGDFDIITVDTAKKKEKPLSLFFNTFACLLKTKKIIVLLSGNGMHFYFPILYFFIKAFGTQIYHDVIGGNLDNYVKNNKSFEKYLNSFRVNWVETENLKQRLGECGINNCEVIPNFKRLNCVKEDELQANYAKPFKFCMFSRVMKEKGIETAIKTVSEINEEAGETVCSLDIYGPIDFGYKNRFAEIMSGVSDAINYKGIVDYDKSVDAIKDYYALLFPTYWAGEGFPGTVIDAFSAGVPVIATDWNSNSEIIRNGKNGIIYQIDKENGLKISINELITRKTSIIEFKRNCIEEAKKYLPDFYIGKMINELKQD